MIKSTNLKVGVIQILTGLALINISDSLNNLGQVNWRTLIIYLVGLACIVSGAELLITSRKK